MNQKKKNQNLNYHKQKEKLQSEKFKKKIVKIERPEMETGAKQEAIRDLERETKVKK